MDLNEYDISNEYDIPTFDLNQSTPSFTELLSGSQPSQKLDIFGNPMLLSRLPTNDFLAETPLYCATKSKKPPSKKNHINLKNDGKNWTDKEDEALMSGWILSSTNSICGKLPKI